MKILTKAAIGLAFGLVVMTATDAWAADTWNLMSTKNPGAEWDWLSGVTAVSSTNVWAVGQYVQSEGSAVVSLIEHFDGSSWTAVNTGQYVDLHGVKATSASNIWAVGDDGSAAILHYDGTNWSKQSSPSVPDGFLYGVGASSASDAWAVGLVQNGLHTTMLIEHWNGKSWKLLSLHNPGTAVNELYGVSSTSSTNVWAVGVYGNSVGSEKGLILHYDGTHWIRYLGRNPGSCGASFDAVSATSPTDVWASGTYCHSGQTGLVEHYDGTSWTSTGFLTSRGLMGIKAATSSSVWAVGQGTDLSSYVAHWNGISWTRQSTPDSPSGADLMLGVAAASSTKAFAVGESNYNANKIRTIAMVCCT